MRRFLAALALLLASALPAGAATITHAVDLSSEVDSDTYTTAAFTPAAGDLLVVVVRGRSTDGSTPIVTGSTGLTFTLYPSSGSATIFAVATDFASAVSQTVTADLGTTSAASCEISVERVSGMAKKGSAAVLQFAVDNHTTETTPALTFASAVNSNNPTILLEGGVLGSGDIVPPSGWTETADIFKPDSPVDNLEVAARASGFSGTTITWGASIGSDVWLAKGIELDASAAGGGASNDNRLLLLGIGN